jgi:hypothetical protein
MTTVDIFAIVIAVMVRERMVILEILFVLEKGIYEFLMFEVVILVPGNINMK